MCQIIIDIGIIILFQIKVTKPKEYLVRPNKGIIYKDDENKSIMCQLNLSKILYECWKNDTTVLKSYLYLIGCVRRDNGSIQVEASPCTCM